MTNDAAFDPTAPLPGPPDPWASTDTPSRRSGPPYHMTDMISAEPAMARRLLESQAGADSDAAALAAVIAEAARAGNPVVVTGCGTSEHAALGTVEILRDAMRSAGLPGPVPVAAQGQFQVDVPGAFGAVAALPLVSEFQYHSAYIVSPLERSGAYEGTE